MKLRSEHIWYGLAVAWAGLALYYAAAGTWVAVTPSATAAFFAWVVARNARTLRQIQAWAEFQKSLIKVLQAIDRYEKSR